MDKQPKDTAAPAAAAPAPVKDEPATAPVAASETKTETPATETPVETKTETKQPPAPKVEDDESDWEELDDVLDDFSNPKSTSATTQPQQSTSTSTQPAPQTQIQTPQTENEPTAEPDADINEDELLKQLEAGMAELMKGAAGDDGAGGDVPVADEAWNALAEGLAESGMKPEDLMKFMLGEGLGGGVGMPGGSSGAGKEKESAAGSSASASGAPESFQDTIRKTMERMQESGDKATAAASEGADDDLLMQVLKAMEAGGAGGDGDDENLDKIFMGIMEQLSNKEMLYEPMKELHDKFGPWMNENREKVSKEDLERYEGQATLVAEIVAKFEEKGYSDDNPAHRSYVWERMQKMQAAGSPPDDLVSNPFGDDKEMAKALGGEMPGCPQQ